MSDSIENNQMELGQIHQDFEQACAKARQLPDVDPSDLLDLYALYKQAVVGDASGPRPGILDLRKQAKFDAWAAIKGMPVTEAMQSYTRRINELIEELYE